MQRPSAEKRWLNFRSFWPMYGPGLAIHDARFTGVLKKRRIRIGIDERGR